MEQASRSEHERISVREAAEILGVDESTVWRRIADGTLPKQGQPRQHGQPRALRVLRPQDVEAYLDKIRG